MRMIFPLSILALASCGQEPRERDAQNMNGHSSPNEVVALNDAVPAGNKMQSPALIPPAPGEVGGLPDDLTPVVEGSIDPKSAQGAGQVLQQWGGALEQRRFGDAWTFSSAGSFARKQGEATFTKFWSKYREIHVLIGAPEAMEGAAGSSFVEIPVQIYGRMADGTPYNLRGPAVLRRVNDVPGATKEQLQWRIESTDLKPMGVVKEAKAE